MDLGNPTDVEIAALLRKVRTIAIVGLSPDPDRPSYSVGMYLQKHGYRIVPVRPGGVQEVLGEKTYARLADVPFPVDLVDLFRNRRFVAQHVEEAIALRVPALWMQEGVHDLAAAQRARAAGLVVVQDRCLLKAHRRLGSGAGGARRPRAG